MKFLLVLLMMFSFKLSAAVFPENIQVEARVSMQEFLENEEDILSFQILNVQYIDMDPGGEYYLSVEWIQGERKCHSEIAWSKKNNEALFLEMKRDCK